MSKAIDIDGVRFESSAAIAARFNCDADRVSSLAREGKLEASKVGNLWFIDPASYEAYMLSTESEKEAKNKNAVKRQADAEAIASLLPNNRENEVVSVNNHVLALGQTLAVVCCGLLVGGLGWHMYTTQISTLQLQAGAYEIMGQFEELFSVYSSKDQDAAVYQTVEMTRQENGSIFTTFPLQRYEPQYRPVADGQKPMLIE